MIRRRIKDDLDGPKLSRIAAILLPLLFGACSSSPADKPNLAPPQHGIADLSGRPTPEQVSDPLERFNRGMYTFNAKFDRHVFLPVVGAYQAVAPVFVRKRVSNFFQNLGEVTSLGNGLLQLRLDVASTALIRFLVNSTVGLAGLFDPITALGAPPEAEDFGQTLGYWGVPPGPYLVLPFAGPSSLRDTTGLVSNSLMFSAILPNAIETDPAYRTAQLSLQPIDTRHRTAFRYFETGSPFEYELVRFVYLKKRDLDIRK